MNRDIKAIETHYNGFRFRSRVEARWAVFFDAANIQYEYELEGFDIEGTRYLPDFYLPEYRRWVEIKGKLLTVQEMKKCEEFCYGIGEDDVKFSILIGTPSLHELQFNNGTHVLCLDEFTWSWPSELHPQNELYLAKGICEDEYYSRFIPAVWCINELSEEQLEKAVRICREARFEFNEHPNVDVPQAKKRDE